MNTPRKGSQSKRQKLERPVHQRFKTQKNAPTDDNCTKSSYQADFKDYTGSLTTENVDHIIHDTSLKQAKPRTDPPASPSRPLVSQVTSRTCQLEWNEPQDDGGLPVEKYHIQCRSRDSCGWTNIRNGVTTASHHRITVLKPGTVYQFRIAAENEAGIGVGGEESEFVQAAEPPGRPSIPHALEVTRKFCMLSWKSPKFDGGTAVTGYQVEYRMTKPDVLQWSRVTRGLVLGNQFLVRDLIPVAGYHFRIVAVNKKGEGEPGPESALIEAIDPPGPVEAPSVSNIDSKSCVLSWNSPNDDGGSPVLGYHVDQLRTDSFGWMRVNKSKIVNVTSYQVTDLITSFKYKFRIIAENKKGEGQQGKESQEVEAVEPPGAPLLKPEVYDVTFHSCMVSWQSPEQNGGTPITGYRVEMKEQNMAEWVTAGHLKDKEHFHRINGLMENHKYTFRVRAVNKVGAGNPGIHSDTIQTKGCDIADCQSIALIETVNLESWGMVRVRDSFQRGLNGISLLVESITPLRCSVSFREIQRVSTCVQHYATQAYFNMKDASDKALLLNNEFSKRIEELAFKQSQKEGEVMRKEGQIAQLRADIAEKKAHLTVLQNELFNASLEYNAAQERMKEAEKQLSDKKKERDTVRGVGFGLMVIPIVGWIAGGTMVAVSFTELEKNVKAAEDMCNTASENMAHQRQRVGNKRAEINQFQGQLDQNESEKNALNAEIGQLTQNIQGLRTLYTAQSLVSENLRKCASFISITADRAEVLHDQVKFLYNPQTIVGPLTELAAQLALPEMSRFGLQYDDDGLDLFVTKLKMIADADACWKQENVLEFRKDHKVLMATDEGKKNLKDVTAVEQISDSLYTDATCREDRRIMLSQHAGWEHFLVPAPMTIAFLGQLMLISTQKDFPLDKNPPNGGFQLLQWPKSFRASVLQVANTGWNAFNTANRSMDQIRIYVNTVPLHLNSAFDMLVSASNEEVEKCLPLSMMSIKNIAEKCLQRAKVTQDGFVYVMDLIAELQEACVTTKGHYERQRQYAQISLDVAKEEKRVIEEEKEFFNKQKEQLRESIQGAEKQFSEALTSLPSGLEVLGMAVAEGIVNGVTTVLGGASKSYQKLKKKFGKTDENDNDQKLDEPSRKSYKQVLVLKKIVDSLVSSFVTVNSLKIVDVQRSTEMISCAKQVELVCKELKAIKDCQVKEEVKELSVRASSICTRLNEIKQNISDTNQHEADEIASSMISLQEDTAQLSAIGQSLMDSCPRQRPPNMKSRQSRDEADGGAVSRTIDKVKMKAEESCKLLENAQENYDKSSEDLKEASRRLSDILGEMAKLDIEKLDFQQIIDILHRGLLALGDMRKQWGKVVYFFQTITNIIDCSLNISLKRFLDISEKGTKSALEGYNITHLKRDMLYYEVIHISELAWFVSLVAESYSEVSAQHLMPKLDGLHKLLSYNPAKNKSAIQLKQQTLHTECTDAQRQIADLSENKKREFHRLVDRRVAVIRQEMKKCILADPRAKSVKKQINTDARTTEANTSQLCVDDFI